MGFLSFSGLFIGIIYTFWILIFYQLYVLQIIFPTLFWHFILLLVSFFNGTFDFEIIVDSHRVARNNTERSLALLTQFSSIIMYGKTLVQYHNWDIDTANIQDIFLTRRISRVVLL